MAAQLKHFFDANLVRSLADDLHRVHPSFPRSAFIADCVKGLDALEFSARARHIANAFHKHLPTPFEAAVEVLLASLGPPLEQTEDNGMGVFRYWPHIVFVQERGLASFEAAMRAQYELTQRFTAEWSIRPYLVHHPDATLAQLEKWSRDASPHVRRLVSEGTRTRLPWATRLPAFQKDPKPVLALLERLKDDPSRYVQRSVANNLNDLAKDHPKLVVATCKRWLEGAHAGRKWIVGHALRSLVKAGDRDALKLLGAGAAPKVQVSRARLEPKTPRLGDTVRFSFELASQSRKEQALVVDFAVHFVKANGDTQPKVFKLTKLALQAGATVMLNGKISFADLTTRRHYAGRHQLEARINGQTLPLGSFDVKPR